MKIIWLESLFNFIEITIILLILSLALAFQFHLHELPCPLCLLQRIGFMCTAIGFLLNLRYGFRPSHYAVALLGSLYTSLVALRQIILHVVPGTGGYGSPIFGLHLYTWSFIISISIIITTSILLSIDRQYLIHFNPSRLMRHIVNLLFIAVILVISINLVAVILECGLTACPDTPTYYKLLKSVSLPSNNSGLSMLFKSESIF